MTVKIYRDLGEALDDIVWEGKGHRTKFTVNHNKNERAEREREVTDFFSQEFGLWIVKRSRLEQMHGKEYSSDVGRILWELLKNAEYESKRRQNLTVELYVGNTGCLMGTRQQARFLSNDEIELLTEWQDPIPSTKKEEGSGIGTQIFLEEGDGILILKKQKAIYVSKYIPKQTKQD